jgi:hypothetical protein
MEIWGMLVAHDRKTAGDTLNDWRVGIFVLTKAGHASLAAGRTP